MNNPEDMYAFVESAFKGNDEQVQIYENEARESAKSLKTGFKTVRTGAYNPGEEYELRIPRKAVTTICAKSGGGKTTDLLNLAFNLRANNYKGIFLTLEEPASDLFAKTMSLFTRRLIECDEPQNFYECKKSLGIGFSSWKWKDQFKAHMKVDGLRFLDGTRQGTKDDPLSPTMLQDPRFLKDVLNVAKDMGDKLDFIIIDYVQLMDAGNGFESTARNMKEVMQIIRYIVGNFSAAIIIGAQMSRQVAFLPFNEWQKEHLADGSEIEKSSNMIIALCVKNASTTENPHYMMGLRVLKNRGGPVGLQSLHDVDFQYSYIDGKGKHDPDVAG